MVNQMDIEETKADVPASVNPNEEKDPLPVNPFFSKSKPKAIQMEMPWLEKYRPSLLKEIVGNEDTVARLQVIAENGNVPNLILVGPPGTGKTTSIHALAMELLGAERYKSAILELNASDDRGIDVVRNKIKSFAKRKVQLPPGRHKIIILDEADSMTGSAQQALRRTMELFASTTRFALACNISSKVIEPIQSRCAILRYQRLEDKHILRRIKYVMRQENILQYTDAGLEAILFVSAGDMRHALNALQSTYAGFKKITQEAVYKVCDQPHPKTMKLILEKCAEKRFRDALALMHMIMDNGYSTQDFIQTMFRVVKGMELEERMKLDWIKIMGMTHMRVAEGTDSILQIMGCLAKMSFGKDLNLSA